MNDESLGFETLAIHAGQDPDPVTGAVVPPIYQTSTYKQDGVGGTRGGYEYSRTANPTRTALETCLAALENGAAALAFASGMAAEDCLIRTLCRPGDRVNQHVDLAARCHLAQVCKVARRRGLGIDERHHATRLRQQLEQHPSTFAVELTRQDAHAGQIAARLR